VANNQTVIVGKNRKRATWALIIVLFMLPVSGWLLYTGLLPGRPDVAWAMIIFGIAGLVAFAASAVAIIRTMRSPWHLALEPTRLILHTPTYDLNVPWERVSGIVVDEVNRKPGCALIFDDPATVVQGATFHGASNQSGAVNDATTMQTRLEESFLRTGYHLGIPGRLLELDPDALAEQLVKARTGQLWKRGG
jgi:hypothetical protein